MTRRLKEAFKATFYALLVFFLRVVTKILFRLRVRGRERVQQGGSYIAVARHRSYWDIPLLAVAFGWKNRIHFIARRGLMRNPLFNVLIRLYATAIDRENFTKGDFRRMLESIRRERLIGVFPEGTTRRAVDAKAGAIHFARLTGKELLPVNIGAVGPYPPRYPFRFPRITISIGHPFAASELEEGEATSTSRAERYHFLGERLMRRVDAA